MDRWALLDAGLWFVVLVWAIALNLCRDRMRRTKGKAVVSLTEAEEGGTGLEMASGRPSALDLVLAGDLARAVAEAVASLPEEQREVIVLKEYQELTFVEIALVLGVPLSTVKTRLYRGLGQLRLHLERQGIRRAAPVPAAL